MTRRRHLLYALTGLLLLSACNTTRHVQLGQYLLRSVRQLSYEELSPELAARYPLWVNTTPVGLQLGETLQLPYEALTPAHYCYDLIYNPSPTRFLELAAARGAQTKDGLEMLHLQADAAWHIWTSHD